jgi:isoleucyl-tRNA synthetase
VTTGTILAEDGSKMSKSKNNYPDPWGVIEKYGVDALRFYLMNSVVMQADNLNFSEKDLAINYRKVILILWNVFNYFVTYANEAGWPARHASQGEAGGEPKQESLKSNPKSILDQWIMAKTQELVNEVTSELDKYNTVRATRAIEQYIDELSTWYLRRSRGRKDSDFFGTLRHCLLTVAKVAAPVLPYVSEIIYQNLNRKTEIPSVHLVDWLKTRELSDQEKSLLKQMELIREAVTVGLSARKNLKLPVRQPLYRLSLQLKSKDAEFSPELLEILLSELNVKKFDSKLSDEAKTNNKVFGAPGTQNIEYFYLDTTIDQKLKIEGLARGLERAVQEKRKEIGLKVGESINLTYDTDDEEIIAAFELFDKKKTYVKEVVKTNGLASEEIDVDGKKLNLRIT